MRQLTSHRVNGCNSDITIDVLDEPGHGGACHQYKMTTAPWESPDGRAGQCGIEQRISFQNGPIKECGTNGTTHEALLAILEDRLAGFQSGPYACQENQEALDHVRAAQAVLKSRTEKRLARGVEGTHTV